MRMLLAASFCGIIFYALPAPAKSPHFFLRIHAEANAHDGDAFSSNTRSQITGKDFAIEKIPSLSERDVAAFRPYRAADGSYGVLLQLDDHGRLTLDTLSVEKRGSFLFVFANGRALTELQIDRRVTDGKIYLPSGLTAAEIALMTKDWPLIGAHKK
jgi:hypothetical protein